MNKVASFKPIVVLSDIQGLWDHLTKCLRHTENIVNLSASLKNELTSEDVNLLNSSEVIICDGTLFSKYYKYMHNLKWLHSTWAGVEPFLKHIKEKPKFILTRHCSDAFSNSMAEYVLQQVLNNERSSKILAKHQAQRNWVSSSTLPCYRMLNELSIAILGTGHMGKAIAKYFKAFGTEVFGYNQSGMKSSLECFDVVSTKLEEILLKCDYIVNTLPSTQKTKGLLNEDTFDKYAKKCPYFINVGRGNIISEKKLVNSLNNCVLSGMSLDVFEEEPLPEDSELWAMDKVTITFHTAALSRPDHVASEFLRLWNMYQNNEELPVVDWDKEY